MKEMDKLIKVYTGTENLVRILKDKLEQEGIPSTIQNDSGDSFFRGTPIALDLYINQLDFKKAGSLIHDFLKEN